MSSLSSELLEPLIRLRGDVSGLFHGLSGEAVPEPYQALLVHEGDMTSRLEKFHRGKISLEVLQSRRAGKQEYCREVVLRRESDGGAVEYGAIEIFLDAFEVSIQELILQGTIPLGGILNANHVHYHSEPQAYFRMLPEPKLAALLGAGDGVYLYGRCNLLRHDGGALIARIVEILPGV